MNKIKQKGKYQGEVHEVSMFIETFDSFILIYIHMHMYRYINYMYCLV